MYGIEQLDPGYERLFDAVATWAGSRDAVRALFISGSLATDTADALSDLDLLVIADNDDVAMLIAGVSGVIGALEPIVIENHLGAPPASVLSIVTSEWHRIDVALGDRESVLLRQPLITVFDPDSLYAGAPAESVRDAPDAERLAAMSKEFLRILGLSVVVLGRNDVHAAHDGANLLRGSLIELFLMEPAAGRRSSAKKLRPALTGEQQAILKSLPPLADDHDMIVAFSEAIAGIFIPRARALTESVGGTWPIETEKATRAHLARFGTLSI